MKMHVQVNNKTNFKFANIFFERVLEETIISSQCGNLSKKQIELSVAIVDDEEIANINKRYRNKNKVTDVLSFAEYETCEELEKEKEQIVMLGELIICPEYVKKSAEEQGFTLENEFVYIVSHGILHLLGFDHGKEMFAIQEELVNKIIEK